MSRPWVGGAGAGQLALVAVDLGDLLPPDHLAWDVQALVGELDLSGFEAAYRADGVGRPPFAPAMMVSLIVYCRMKKLTGSRQIEAACHDDLGARVITGNLFPSRGALDRFMGTHAVALKQLLTQTLRLGAGEGLVDVRVVAGDGTKVLANASRNATLEEPQLHEQITGVQAQIAATASLWAAQIAAEHTGEGRTRYGKYFFNESLLAAQAQQAGRGDGDGEPAPVTANETTADKDTPGEGIPTGVGDSAKTWRKLQVLQVRLGRLQEAAAYLVIHPGKDFTAWAQRVALHEKNVARAQENLDAARNGLHEKAQQRAREEAGGRKIPGTRPVPAEEHTDVRRLGDILQRARTRLQKIRAAQPTHGKVNITDPGSRLMPGKHDGFGQRHNIQALTCKNQFILAIASHPNANDKQALQHLLDAARANLDAAGIHDKILVALFDSGYASEANFTADLPVDTLLIAVTKKHRQKTTSTETSSSSTETSSSSTETSSGTDETSTETSTETSETSTVTSAETTSTQAWQIMTDRLAEPANQALYKRRSAIIEPLFAQLFHRFGRNLTLRAQNVDTELHLWAVTHNLAKINRHRHKPHPPG